MSDGGEYSQRQESLDLLGEGASQGRFLDLKEEEFESVAKDIEARWKGASNMSTEDIMRSIINFCISNCVGNYMYRVALL